MKNRHTILDRQTDRGSDADSDGLPDYRDDDENDYAPPQDDSDGEAPTQPVAPQGAEPEVDEDVLEKPYVTAIMSVNENGLPLEASALAVQVQIQQQATARAAHGGERAAEGPQARSKKGRYGAHLVSGDIDYGDGKDGKTLISTKQHRLASLVTPELSVIMAQEVHLAQAHGEILLALYRDNYPIDGEYAAGVRGEGEKRPRNETAGVLTLWHKNMWQRATIAGGKQAPPTRWNPQGRLLTVQLESLVNGSELVVTNGYAPQAGRERAAEESETFGRSLSAAASLHAEVAPHVMGMDANGGPPGYEAGTPNDAWLADLHNGQSGEYKRAGKNAPTHFSVKAGSGRGTIGYRAAVYHAVNTAAKRKSATASTITGSWVALPEHHWCPTLEAPATPTPAAASRPGVGTRRQADLDGSWRDFVLYFVDHEEPLATDGPGEVAVPRPALHGYERRWAARSSQGTD